MKTSIIGYPRIGSLRELKFASEKYFRGEISTSELQETAKQLRLANLNTQRESGLDFIPSGDFSFYDGMLDTAVLLNIVPERYRNLNLSELDTYFAMARGYQGEKGDVKAFAMKKWFNTNYHYMVPEIDDTTEIKLSGNKPFELFAEAFKNGVKTKPVMIGAYTFLKLSKYTGNKTAIDFADAIAGAYADILKQFVNAGADWVQFDEPCLVMDMTAEDKVLFTQLYQKILSDKKGIKVLLQTYFGDVRDCYSEICGLNFDGVGLDFVEGKKNLELIQTNDFPTDKVLFAGVINGKNIWKNHYANTLCIISELKKHCTEIVLSTSCSLLHVPYTLKNETKLTDNYKKHFAYAEEKLLELAELKVILSSDLPLETKEYQNNTQLFIEPRSGIKCDVQKQVGSLSYADFTRLPVFAERETIQKERFQLPLFPTTTIGSFPQTPDVRITRAAFRKGKISEEQYYAYMKEKISECVKLQEEIGLDVLVHGEFERNDMVEYFGECLDGYIAVSPEVRTKYRCKNRKMIDAYS